jgi:predicted 3-demethylubiquinone-9 3-methyltransferase (glyoxalase superfamily)
MALSKSGRCNRADDVETPAPSFSFFVECESDEEIQRVHDVLLEDRQPVMPLDNYGFSQRFAWTNDRFGVAWQLNLA